MSVRKLELGVVLNWRDKKAERSAAAILRELDGVLRVNDEGNVRLGWNDELMHAASIVEASATTSLKIHEQRRVWLARSAIIDAKKAGNLNPAGVLGQLRRVQKSYLGKKKELFVLVARISVRDAERLGSTRLDGATLTFSRRLPRRFRRRRNRSINERLAEVDRAGYGIARVALRERDTLSAGNVAIDRLDLLRGMWNLLLNRGRTKIGGGRSGNAPTNDVVLGPIHSLHYPDGREAGGTHWWEPTHIEPAPLPHIQTAELTKVLDSTRWLRRRLKSVPLGPQLSGMIIRYTRALDERDHSSSFLKLWALLEDLVDVERARYDDLVRRVKFVSPTPEYTAMVFENMRRFRNRAIHDGDILHEPHIFMNEVKRWVEVLWFFILNNPRHFQAMSDVGAFLSLPRSEALLRKRLGLHRLAINVRD